MNILLGLVVALIILLVTAARYGARTARETTARPVIGARATVVGAAAFVTGLIAVGIVIPVGMAILQGNDTPVQPVPVLTGARVILGVAAVLALCAVLAYGLGVWLRRGVGMKTLSNYTNHIADTPLDPAWAAQEWTPVNLSSRN